MFYIYIELKMPNCSPVVNVDKYAVDAVACKQLPLDSDFLNSFNGGSKNRKRSRTRKRTLKRKNQKAGSVGFVLDLESPTMGGLARVKGYSSQPIYQDGQMQDYGEICGGGKIKRTINNDNNKKKSGKKVKKSKKGKKGKKSINNCQNNGKKNNCNRNNRNNRNNSNKGKKKNNNGKKKVKNVKGGGDGLQSVFTHNMNERQFGCRQPEWDPKCT